MSIHSSRVLVTGGAGFLGRHIARAFSDHGSEVLVVDISDSPPDLAPIAVKADVRDFLRESAEEFDVLLHFAAVVGGRLGIEYRRDILFENVSIDEAMFDFASRTRPRRVVYMSSSAVYPVNQQASPRAEPLREEEIGPDGRSPGPPDLGYGLAKRKGEQRARELWLQSGVAVSVYRPFTVYGPGQPNDYPATAIAERALHKSDPLVIWGSGHQCRDFVYVDDFIRILLATWDKLSPSVPLNVATGVATSFIEVGKLAAELVGYEPALMTDPTKPEGVRWRVGSPSKLAPQLRPRVPLRNGFTQLLEHLACHA